MEPAEVTREPQPERPLRCFLGRLRLRQLLMLDRTFMATSEDSQPDKDPMVCFCKCGSPPRYRVWREYQRWRV